MIKEMKNMILKNFKTIIKFEFIFKIVTLLVATPIFFNIFKMIMKVTGYSYLTIENIANFILNPLTFILIFLFLLIVGFYSIFDIGTIIILLDSSKQNKKVELKDAVNLSLKKSINIFKPKNFGLLILVLFLIPFLNLGIGSGAISSIKIPEFISDYIEANKILSVIYAVLVLFLLHLLLKWIYSLHYYFLEDKSFKEAHKYSSNLSKNSHIKDLITLVVTQVIFFATYVIYIILGILLIISINHLFKGIVVLDSVLITAIVAFMFLSLVIFSILSTVYGYVLVSYLFYEHKAKINEKVEHINVKKFDEKFTKSKWSHIIEAFSVLGFFGFTFFTYGVIKGNYNLNIEYVRNMEITAHRGASALYPENTLLAFIGAKNLGADWIELDVQQTKDQKIIVCHDTNLKRITGENINSWEATYADIEKLDAGSFKDESFKGEKIQLLESIVSWANINNVKLNIELKPTGHETDFEKQVVDIIKKYNFEDDCVITSQEYKVLENVKKVDENIKTVYVMSLAFGNITELDKADYFSVEATSITKKMVSQIHKQGKQIYGWTVNTEEGINKMIKLNVDNIITDDITLGKRLVFQSKNSNIIIEIINGIQSIFM